MAGVLDGDTESIIAITSLSLSHCSQRRLSACQDWCSTSTLSWSSKCKSETCARCADCFPSPTPAPPTSFSSASERRLLGRRLQTPETPYQETYKGCNAATATF